MSNTLQEVCDQREDTTKISVESIISFALACKQLSDKSAQTYEFLVEDPKLKNLETQLQEVQQQ
jgi:hypothetical protein